MKLRFLAIGTLFCGTAFGVIAGESIATVPKYRGEDLISAAPIVDDSAYQQVEAATPDHYPLITRSGRFEVEDLWKRRPLRMRPYMPEDFPPEPAFMEEPVHSYQAPSDRYDDQVASGRDLTIERAEPQDQPMKELPDDKDAEPITVALQGSL